MENLQEITGTNPFNVIAHDVCVEVHKAASKKRRSYRTLMERGDELLDELEQANLADDVWPEQHLLDRVTAYGRNHVPNFDIRIYITHTAKGLTINDALDVVYAAQSEILYDHVPEQSD